MKNNIKIVHIVIITSIVMFLIISIMFYNNTLSLYPHYLFFNKLRSSATNASVFNCSLRGDKWIVVTTIFYPTLSIHKFLNLTTEWNLIVIGDRKTPKDWQSRLMINSSRLLYLSIDQQATLGYHILNYIPEGSYARKNIGYLVAIACGARIIYESDDDNLLEKNDIQILPKRVQSQDVPWIAFHRQRSPFVNIYGSFGQPNIWPRGFPVDELRNVTEDGWHSVRRNLVNNTDVYIQQYLADLDPDVDALVSLKTFLSDLLKLLVQYRLGHPLSIGRIKFDRNQSPILLQPFTFSPYNTQNTISHYEAFWGLYLPITTTFRVCDIWRSFWVQRLLWDIGGHLVFATSTVQQIRNTHSYIKDMDEEQQLYHQSGSFVRFLASWSSSLPSLAQRISQLAEDIAEARFWNSKEIDIINAWIADLRLVGYTFPPIVSTSSSRSPIEKRAAVCVTGLVECIQEAWIPTDINIRKRLRGDIDTFLFLSSSYPKGPVPLATRLQQARYFKNSTVTILYEDRVIDPDIPKDCNPKFQKPNFATIPVPNYFQQLWALSQCYNLVREYEKNFNIKYQLFIRARIDTLAKMPSTFEREGSLNINTTIIIPRNRYFPAFDDGFALGPIEHMHYYMTRWDSFKGPCPPDSNYHAESYLTYYLKRFTNVTIDKNMSGAADAIPHGSRSCH